MQVATRCKLLQSLCSVTFHNGLDINLYTLEVLQGTESWMSITLLAICRALGLFSLQGGLLPKFMADQIWRYFVNYFYFSQVVHIFSDCTLCVVIFSSLALLFTHPQSDLLFISKNNFKLKEYLCPSVICCSAIWEPRDMHTFELIIRMSTFLRK